MSERPSVFSEDETGTLVQMAPAAPPSEDELQELIAKHPMVVAASEEPLLLVRREMGVAGESDGNARWSLDHLFVTLSGVPVLVEVKRASDTRIRREVVGQILDYAANGSAYWSEGALRASFEASHSDWHAAFADFAGDTDPDEFWDRVERNLYGGRVRLVIAADLIPPELARVVEFLNGQMRAEVLAVELLYYRAENGRRTLAPRVIGESELAKATKPNRATLSPLSVEDWLAKYIDAHGPDTRRAADDHLRLLERLGATIRVASTQGSVLGEFVGGDAKPLYPMHLMQNGMIAVSFGWTAGRGALVEKARRREVLDAFVDALGSLSTENLNGHPGFRAERLLEDGVFEHYARAVEHYVALAKGE